MIARKACDKSLDSSKSFEIAVQTALDESLVPVLNERVEYFAILIYRFIVSSKYFKT